MADRLAWGPWRQVHRGRIPDCPGCYAVYENGVLVYVGSSANLAARCRVYFTKSRMRGRFDYGDPALDFPQFVTPWGFRHHGNAVTVKVKVSRRLGDWLMREYRLIRRLQPRENRAGIVRTFERSEQRA